MNDLSMCFVLNEAYSFRMLVEYLKATNIHGNFVFGKNSITYEQNNLSNTILNIVEIRTCDINYYLNPVLENHVIGIDLSNFNKRTKVISRKDGAKFYQKNGKDKRLVFKHLPANNSQHNDDNNCYLTPKIIEQEKFIMNFPIPENSPNCTIPIAKFCKVCSSINVFKPSYVRITGYKSSFLIEGLDSSREVIKEHRFNIPNVSVLLDVHPNNVVDQQSLSIEENLEEDPISIIYTDSNILKSFTKINNIPAPAGNIKIYFAKNMPIKLILSIGDYGKLTSYLRSSEEEASDGEEEEREEDGEDINVESISLGY